MGKVFSIFTGEKVIKKEQTPVANTTTTVPEPAIVKTEEVIPCNESKTTEIVPQEVKTAEIINKATFGAG